MLQHLALTAFRSCHGPTHGPWPNSHMLLQEVQDGKSTIIQSALVFVWFFPRSKSLHKKKIKNRLICSHIETHHCFKTISVCGVRLAQRPLQSTNFIRWKVASGKMEITVRVVSCFAWHLFLTLTCPRLWWKKNQWWRGKPCQHFGTDNCLLVTSWCFTVIMVLLFFSAAMNTYQTY